MTALSKIYTYLWQKKKGQVREIFSVWNLKLGGNKLGLLLRCLMLLWYYESKGTDVFVKFESNDNCEDFLSFPDRFSEGGEDWIEVPSFSTSKAYLCKVGDKFYKQDKQINNGNRKDPIACGDDLEGCEAKRPKPNFSLSESARLAVLMRDDEVARSMLFRLPSPRSWNQREGVGRYIAYTLWRRSDSQERVDFAPEPPLNLCIIWHWN